MESRDDEGASLVIFRVEGNAAGESVGTTSQGDVFRHVEIEMEEASAVAQDGIFDGVGIADQAPAMVGSASSHQCVPERIMP
jgi:hypothetical protein